MGKKTKNEGNGGLKRNLNPMSVWAIAFGCIIGWGSFINPGKKFLPKSGVYGTAIAMVLGALVMIIIAFSYAYMVPKYPKAGGEFTFTKACFGKNAAYFCGWFLVAAYLTNVPMNSTAIALIVDGLFGKDNIFRSVYLYSIAGQEVYLGHVLLACGILVLFAIFNMIGIEKAGFISTALAVTLAVCVFTLFVSALVSSKAKGVNFTPVWGFDKDAAAAAGLDSESSKEAFMAYANGENGFQGKFAAILATFAIAPWAFVGFDTIPQAAEEFKFSYKKVSFIMIIALIFGCFVYVSNNTVAAAAIENWPARVMAGDWVVLIAAEELLGTFGKILVGLGVASAVLSGIMGFYLASSRLMYSMSRDGYLPKVFSKTNRFNVPGNAMIFCLIISMAGPILGREAISWFVDMSAIGASIGYFFTCAACIITIRKCGDKKPMLKFLAILGVVFSLIFVILQLVPIPGLEGVHFVWQSYVMLGIWIAIGLVFYIKQRKQFGKTEEVINTEDVKVTE